MRRAAELGNTNAQNNLGTMLADENPQEAEHWYRVAVANGSLGAMVNLAAQVVDRDAQQALRLLRSAAEAGDATAAERLADLVEDLDMQDDVEPPEPPLWSTEPSNCWTKILQRRSGSWRPRRDWAT